MKKLIFLISILSSLAFFAYAQDSVVGINGAVYKIGNSITLSSHGASENNDFMFIRKASYKLENTFNPIEASIQYLSNKKYSGHILTITKIDKITKGIILSVKSDKEYYILLDSAIKYSEIEGSNQKNILRFGEVIFPLEDGKIVYTEVVDVNGATKDELYLRTKEWFAKTFVSAKDVIQMDDRGTAKIIGKGLTASYFTMTMAVVPLNINYTVTVISKDGKYKYIIDNIIGEQGTLAIRSPLEAYIEMVEKKKMGSSTIKSKVLPIFKNKIENLISSLKLAMSQASRNDF